MADVTLIRFSLICKDGGTQSRAALDGDTIDAYAVAMRDGAVFPPVTVFYDGTTYWLADGFHRLLAMAQNMVTDIPCDVRQGSKRDAILFSVGANATHGLRRSNVDKRIAVETLLRDEEWSTKSDVWISERCGVSHTFVARVRAAEQPATVASPKARVGKDGKARALPAKKAKQAEVEPTERRPRDEKKNPLRGLTEQAAVLADVFRLAQGNASLIAGATPEQAAEFAREVRRAVQVMNALVRLATPRPTDG